MTSLYDALVLANKSQKANDAPGHSKMIVMLTDGEDTSSKGTLADVKAGLAQCPDITLIAIGLGVNAGTSEILQRLVECSSDGLYIDARDTAALDAAFAKVPTPVN